MQFVVRILSSTMALINDDLPDPVFPTTPMMTRSFEARSIVLATSAFQSVSPSQVGARKGLLQLFEHAETFDVVFSRNATPELVCGSAVATSSRSGYTTGPALAIGFKTLCASPSREQAQTQACRTEL